MLLQQTSKRQKAILYLINQVKVVKDKDVDILVWTLSEFYTMTGIAIVETELLKLIPRMKMITTKEALKNPTLFFLQSLTLKSCYASSGIEDKTLESFIKTHRQQLAAFKDNKNLSFIAAQLLWGAQLKIPEEISKGISIKLNIQDNLLLNDLAHIYIHSKVSVSRTVHKKLQAKLKLLIEQKVKYKTDTRFSAKEAKLLKLVFPAFIYGTYYYTHRHLPSSRSHGPLEEGLDLVD